MLKATLLTLLLASSAVQAHDDDHGGGGGDPGASNPTATAVATGGNSAAVSGSKSASSATSKSSANADSSSASSADSTNTNSATGGTATNAGNTQSTSTTYQAQKNPVSTAIAGVGETTAGCRYHNGGGLQLLGVGISVGHSSKDKDCERIALAEYMYAHGKDIAGDQIMCKVTTVAEALGEDCLALVHELKAVPK
jgi:hypothetical protein